MSQPQTVLITAEQIESLDKIHMMASAYRMRLSQLADQAVEALGLERGEDSYDANMLRSIVIDGRSVEKAIHLITSRRAGAALQRLPGKPVGVMTDQRRATS